MNITPAEQNKQATLRGTSANKQKSGPTENAVRDPNARVVALERVLGACGRNVRSQNDQNAKERNSGLTLTRQRGVVVTVHREDVTRVQVGTRRPAQ
jgi:hypothetical protein